MAISFLKYCQLAYLSGPACERAIYRHIAKLKPNSILEIGLGLGIRTLRMLDVASRHRKSGDIKYTGIDLFETRVGGSVLSLKDAYRLFKRNGVQVRLVPGSVLSSMTATANAAVNTDLIVIDSEISDEQLQPAWAYFPRMMHSGTIVLRQRVEGDAKCLERLTRSAIEKLSGDHSRNAA